MFSVELRRLIFKDSCAVQHLTSEFKISWGTVLNWVHGKSEPSLQMQQEMINFLNGYPMVEANKNKGLTFSWLTFFYIEKGIVSSRQLADEFEVSLSTVNRWSNGKSEPALLIQQQVLNYLYSLPGGM